MISSLIPNFIIGLRITKFCA